VVYRAATGEVWRNGPDPAAGEAFEAPVPAGRSWIRVNGVQMRRADYRRDPAPINQSFAVREDLRERAAGDTFDASAVNFSASRLMPRAATAATRSGNGRESMTPV
jgi:monoamine oxidase